MGDCLFQDCPRAVQARGLCITHWHQLRRGWLTADGRPTPLWRPYRPVSPERRCLVEGCQVNRPLREGRFCTRHWNWYETGRVDRDGRLLGKPPRDMQRRCQADGCEVGPSQGCRGLCRPHFDQEAAGTQVARRGCRVCGLTTGRLVKQLCSRHYAQVKKGLIDHDGQELRDHLKHAPYGAGARCRARGCQQHPSSRGFCDRHYGQWSVGAIDDNGRPLRPISWYNRGQTCRHPKCTAKAHCKGWCNRHYHQNLRGTLGRLVNRERPCRVEGCDQPAETKQMCGRHYRRLHYMVNRERLQAAQRAYRKRKACTSPASTKTPSREDPTRVKPTPSIDSPGKPDSSQATPST